MPRAIPAGARRGQGLVEFALAMPIFFLLAGGLLEGGRLVFTYVSLGHATEEGGRLAVLPGTASPTAVQARVVDAAAPLDVVANDVVVTVNGGVTPFAARDSGDRVRVDATVAYQPVIATVFGGGTMTLSASSELMVE